ncbi:WalN protein [Pokkaliibacter plantistimulans]|uniref:WalN protein n=1 Tax=Pokkaliibacter plantistimulans TaxID=1635171 RepID=A0ABX5M3Z8_9GAMM|nr:glycosyltransferase family 4 protein [Pokkaliibacter plantistimulans]PXF33119.1 WalN protein [Pokkaliibacter plantistimulans]
MKIAFIDVTTTVSYGGVQTAVWQLAVALTDLGHEVHVYGGSGKLEPDLAGREVHIHRFSFTPRERVLDLGSRFQRLVERWSFSRHARQHFIAQHFDWAVLTKPFDFFWPRLMPKQHRTRFAFMSGGTDFIRGDRKLAQGISAWLACSNFNAWQLQHHFKRFPTVMFNGVDTAVFHPQDGSEARATLGLNPQDIVIGFAGRLVGWKGLSVAVQALADSRLHCHPVKLLIVGDGEERSRLAELAKKLGVAERLIMPGACAHAQLPKLYAACDMGVFPSIGDEAFGITIAEAMSCGLPVVASYIGGIPEVVGNEGGSGLLFTPGHAQDLADQLLTLIEQPELRARMGRVARQRIERMFTWRMAAQRLLKVLESH